MANPKRNRDIGQSFGLTDAPAPENKQPEAHNNILLKALNDSKQTAETGSRAGIGEIQYIPIALIKSKDNPRKTFTEESLNELADNIKKIGLLQPIAVRKTSDGYDLIYGERRLRAFKINNETLIPAIVKNIKQLNTELIPEIKLMENLHREDLSDFEIALSLTEIKNRLKLSDNDLRSHVNKSLSWVKHKLIHANTANKLIELGKNEESMISFLDKLSTTAIVDLQPIIASHKESALGLIESHIKKGTVPIRDEIREFAKSFKNRPDKNSNSKKKESGKEMAALSQKEIREKISDIMKEISRLNKLKSKFEKMLKK
ncbi:ParB/RepB/Spo0J family partition protein [Leptospira kmetyi]|uniref:Chromosome partitioning protein ParB n=1 Tax=Leptospira kmetyi TaxID=408139 RepID=A0ABX4N6P6_9LEPT|nr:ParB/RepB/Spo0J family partition protein [Leptospira kmetyi]PJZ29059.1 chromosome partitioning protein ParB [Leptospira kmetyi]PJZ39697.1 chromosome partitioning protein ParB [Leptospira kmetyi]